MSALMLTAILATWLCIAGLPNLKDWQPLMAACIALIGGALAYKGAMDKINLDRELANRQIRWDKKALIVRLQTSLLVIRKKAVGSQAFIEANIMRKSTGMKLDGLGLPKPEMLDEAWQSLGWFPPDIAFKIANIRENQIGLLDALTNQKGVTFSPSDVEAIFQMFKRVENYSTVILEWTSPGLKDVDV